MINSVTWQASWPATGPLETVRVLFFGKVADRFGRTAYVPIPAGGCTLSTLKRGLGELVEGGQAALDEPGVHAAAGQETAVGDVWVRPGQEVAFFTAFSGG